MRRPVVCAVLLASALALACGGDSGPNVTADTLADPGIGDTGGKDVPVADPGTDGTRPDTPPPDDVPPVDPGTDGTPPADVPTQDGTPGDTASDAPDVKPDVPGPACETTGECEALLGDLGPCQVALCDSGTGRCRTLTLVDNTPCGLPDACQPILKCKAGECIGNELDCDDDNPCTDDSCAPATGCAHLPNTMACNDGNPCTTGDACQAGTCSGTNQCACEADGDCESKDDGDLCNGRLVCVDKACVPDPETVVTCEQPDAYPCTVATCNPATGQCENAIENNGAACEDGSLCTTDDLCVRGECQGGPAPDCNDLNSCTDDWCDHLEGCKHRGNDLPCDDGSTCTEGDTCIGGSCQSGTEIDCTDGNDCTADTCDPVQGCVRLPIEGGCEDGNACTVGDVCQAGKCTAVAERICNDGNPCTTDSCDRTLGCVNKNNTGACDDGNACTTGDTCSGGECLPGTPVECDDGKDCTQDSCNPATGCVHEPLSAVACSDGNACTDGDTCAAGTCKAGAALDCNDGESCTTDTCQPATGCVHTPLGDGVGCDDGNGCTTGEKCKDGKCLGAGQNCDDGNPCTDDGCEAVGGCTHTNNTKACDDGNACTVNDTCGGGTCKSGADRVCDDRNVCTTDTCSKSTGCVYTNNTASCDDGNACTGGDKCSAGKCVGSTPVVCFDGNPCTSDACLPATGCAFTALADGTACDDGQFCTLDDACLAKTCVGATANTCDDGNICTSDSCNETNDLCIHLPNTLSCSDGNTCTHGDTCASGSCSPGALTECVQPNPTCANSTLTPCVCISGIRPTICSEKGSNGCLPKPVGTYAAGCYCGQNPECSQTGLTPYCVCTDPRDPTTCGCKARLL